jgi:hypothetical protein
MLTFVRCSAYSLAGAYSDPINNEPAGKENEGEGNDQVTYQQQHTADKENIYDHMRSNNTRLFIKCVLFPAYVFNFIQLSHTLKIIRIHECVVCCKKKRRNESIT